MEREHRLTGQAPGEPSAGADRSSGAAGGDLPGPGQFAADDGSVPVEVAHVLQRMRSGLAGLREVVPVLAVHRLLVPLLEVDADQLEGDAGDPCAGQDRAVAAVSVSTEEGTVGLAFTGVAHLAAWDQQARPMPVPAQRVATALLAEGGVGLVVDPGSASAVRLGPVALLRLAQGGPWPAPWQDPAVQQAVVAELSPALASGELRVRLAAPEAGGTATGPADASLLVELRLAAGLPDEQREARIAAVARRLGSSRALREVFDGVLAVRAG